MRTMKLWGMGLALIVLSSMSFSYSMSNRLQHEYDQKQSECLKKNTSWEYGDEEKEAYCYAYIRDITTQDVEHVNWNGKITRAELAKMMVNYRNTADFVRGGIRRSAEECTFKDGKIGGDLEEYIVRSCQYGLMGQNGNGGVNEYFNPYQNVSRAEFSTVLSRVLFGDTFNQTEENKPYYEKHLEALHHYEVINTPDATIQEKRGWIMLMLLRAGNAIQKFENEKYVAAKNTIPFSDELKVLASFDDPVEENSIWCGTFQLVWNRMMEFFNLDKIEFVTTPKDGELIENELADNLNKKTFTKEYLSESGYYVDFGETTQETKTRMENAIKERFNETSKILDSIDWSWGEAGLVSYAMLKKQFSFEKPFEDLYTGNFGDNNQTAIYFGFERNSTAESRDQVEVLFYDDPACFAVKLKTKEKEDVILVRGIEEETFYDIYQKLQEKITFFTGEKTIDFSSDSLKVPNLTVKTKTAFDDLPRGAYISGTYKFLNDAGQTIDFYLDRFGGKVVSEAFMAVAESIPDNLRDFYFDQEFILFLKERDKELPYLAVKVSDISKFQN